MRQCRVGLGMVGRVCTGGVMYNSVVRGKNWTCLPPGQI